MSDNISPTAATPTSSPKRKRPDSPEDDLDRWGPYHKRQRRPSEQDTADFIPLDPRDVKAEPMDDWDRHNNAASTRATAEFAFYTPGVVKAEPGDDDADTDVDADPPPFVTPDELRADHAEWANSLPSPPLTPPDGPPTSTSSQTVPEFEFIGANNYHPQPISSSAGDDLGAVLAGWPDSLPSPSPTIPPLHLPPAPSASQLVGSDFAATGVDDIPPPAPAPEPDPEREVNGLPGPDWDPLAHVGAQFQDDHHERAPEIPEFFFLGADNNDQQPPAPEPEPGIDGLPAADDEYTLIYVFLALVVHISNSNDVAVVLFLVVVYRTTSHEPGALSAYWEPVWMTLGSI